MQRIRTREWLDDDEGTAEEIRESLDDLWRINRWLGGVSSNIKLFQRFFERTGPHPVQVLDVGAGDSRLAARLGRELLRQGIAAEFTALDRRLTHLRNGHRGANGTRSVVSDVMALPFPARSYDVVMCNLFLHHFSGEGAYGLLRQMAEVAREAVLINDLERHVLPYLFIRCTRPFARSRITRHDGPASVRQAFTREELRALAVEAGFKNFEVRRMAPFRLGLILWR